MQLKQCNCPEHNGKFINIEDFKKEKRKDGSTYYYPFCSYHYNVTLGGKYRNTIGAKLTRKIYDEKPETKINKKLYIENKVKENPNYHSENWKRTVENNPINVLFNGQKVMLRIKILNLI